ncbi:MAG: hypothetical protein NZ874_07300 [Fimbriimonadales bacterium]|nr:hypothetical protein [Fimbriimonadales bacterium]
MKGLSMFAKVSIGLVATIVVAAAIFLLGIRPTLQNIQYHEENIALLEQKVAQIPRAQQLVQRAQQRVEQANRDLALIDRKKMPVNTIDLSDRLKAWMQYPDMTREIAKKLEAWPLKTGVQRLYEVRLPPPPNDPNAIPALVLVYPFGRVQVRASSFEGLLNHVRKWNEVPNLVVLVDGLEISGMSPQLFGSYTLTVFVYPRMKGGQPGPNVPSSPQGQGGGAPGGFGLSGP